MLGRGHIVRAVIRPGTAALPESWHDRAELAYADLDATAQPEGLFDGIDVLVHLAATMRGTQEAQFSGTVNATERLLQAMRRSGSIKRLVLASSCSVYDWTAIRGTLTEDSPVETKPSERDSYTAAKLAQEQVARRFSIDNNWILSVLRPGFIYGPGAHPVASAGLRIGPLFLVVAPTARLRLTHVENCAAAFTEAAEKQIAGTFNIIDDEQVSAWRYSGRLARHAAIGSMRIPVPYAAGLAAAILAHSINRLPFPYRRRSLPGILIPTQYRARFKPLRFDNHLAQDQLGWRCKPFFGTECEVI